MASQALHPLFITTILFLTGHTYVTCLPVTDLDDFLELYAGEFSNERQNSEDLANNITGPELHFLLRIFHVPVKVPVLDQAGVKTRQIYLEQYFNDGDAPTRQRIYNFKLQSGCP
ncbi:hypothetical protein BaRGS_00002908 [Batillaria attramentaria]|uniref:Uncharacterized protein n=1 Tax=Batillaria attramentaria TaxID=370345 RepID=A0ABD0M1Q5_9CAEN